MFGVAVRALRTRDLNSAGESLSSVSSLSEEDMDGETHEKTAKLCSIRKRSVEIPLENLLSKVIYLSGGRDLRDGPILSVVQPEDLDVDLLMEISLQELSDMLAYFTFVPSEEVRSRKFSVVVAANSTHDFLLRNAIISLNEFEQQNHLFHMVYILTSSRNPNLNLVEWAYNIDSNSKDQVTPVLVLPFTIVKSTEELTRYIALDQLTSDFGGTFEYDHQDWVRFRMQVEPFICDVVGVSKRLVEAIAPFTQEENPNTIQEAEESLKIHKIQRRKTLETLHVDELASEGERIRVRLHSPAKEHFQNNPDFKATVETIEVLLNRVENVRTRLDGLWTTKKEKLETKIREKKFEKEANQIIEWFEQYAEEFFETHTEMGESLEVAQALVNELLEFEDKTKDIVQHTDKLLKQASKLEGLQHVGRSVKDLTVRIKGLMSDFELKMEHRKKRLDDAVRLHNIMEAAINWCIEGVEFLGNYDILAVDLNDIDPIHTKTQLNQFQQLYPPPTKDDIQMLSDAVSSMESHWGREGFQFALNRIVELHDRFELYHKLLDEMIEQKNEPIDSPELVNGQVSTSSLLSTGSDEVYSRDNSPFSPSPDIIVGRRMSEQGKEIQISVLDIDKSAQHAISILEKTETEAKKLSLTDKIEEEECREPDCLTLLDFLSEAHQKEPNQSNLLDVDKTESRTRSYSAPEDMTDSGGTLQRSRSFNRKKRQTVSTHPVPSKHLDISVPSNPQFNDKQEDISLDDVTVDENPEDVATQTAHARHRRHLMEELITTEEAYIKDLEHVCKYYVPAMDDIENLPPGLLGKKEIIFGLLPIFLKCSRDVILPRIRKCLRAPIKMGLVFLDHEEDFLKYALYFKHKPQQDELMITVGNDFFKAIQEQIGDQMRLFAYLIKPVQRMTKYKQFLEQMVKYTTKGSEQQDVQGSRKQYLDKLKEALKMTDFVLRHGNDLLALESLKGFDGDISEQGRILRVGDLTIIDGFAKHRRKVFLFENSILFCKTRKSGKSGPTGSDVYDYKQLMRTSELMLRENLPGHDCRFALELVSRKNMMELQAESVEQKQEWIQELWDLFFSHMLKLRDDNLQSHGTRALSTLMVSGSATLTRGRPLSHTMRKARLHTVSSNPIPTDPAGLLRDTSRNSLSSIGSTTSLKELADYIRNKRDSRHFGASHIPYSGPISPRSSLAVSFHEKYSNKRLSGLSTVSTLSGFSSDIQGSDRSSVLSTTSTLSGETTGSLEDTITSETKQEMRTFADLAKDRSLSIQLNDSFKMYNTPV